MSSSAVLHHGSRRSPRRGWSEQRSLATNLLLALLIAVVGLLAAASTSLVSRAEEGTARTPVVRSAAADPATVGRRSAALQAALLGEVAAQRGDALARQAQTIARSSLSAAGTARQQRLTEVDSAAQASAAQIAAQRLQAATAARQAAVDAGLAVDPTLDPTLVGQATAPVTGGAGSLPAGTTGALPITTGVVGAKFGAYGHWSRYHTGLDFRAAYGTPIHAVLAGTVVYAGNSGDWAGNHVAVRHADGKTTMYSHMSRMAATVGDTVQTGQVIGYVGETGRAFGAHLHFELYPVGVRYGDVYKAVDPMPYLQSIGVQTH